MLPKILVLWILFSLSNNNVVYLETLPVLSTPILWRRSQYSIAQKLIFQTINFTIQSPCGGFHFWISKLFNDNKTNENYSFLSEYEFWCETLYNQLIVEQINKNCPVVNEIRVLTPETFDLNLSSRSRRSLLTTSSSLVTISLVSVITTLGIYSFQFFSNQMEKIRMDEIEMNYAQRMQQFKWAQKSANQIHKELLHKIILLGRNLQELSQKISEQNFLHLQSTKLLMATTSKLYQIESYFKNFFYFFNKGQISEHFEYLFPNLTLCENCPRKYWIGYKCEMLKRNEPMYRVTNSSDVGMLLKLATVVVDQTHKILEADPFYIMKPSNESNFCFYQYYGKDFFLYNIEYGCVKDIILNPKSASTLIFSYNSGKNCSEQKNFNEFWRETYCKEKKDLLPEEIVQIKSDSHHHYVYCYTFQLTINTGELEQSFTCENYVYKLGRNVSLSIGNHSIFVQYMQQDVWTFLEPKINKIVFNGTIRSSKPELKATSDIKTLDINFHKIKHLIEQENEGTQEWDDGRTQFYSFLKTRFIYILILIIFSINLLLIFVVCIYNCCKRSKSS